MDRTLQLVLVVLVIVCNVRSMTTTTMQPIHGIPSGEALNKIVEGSFHNVDGNDNGFIERFEFDTLVIVADNDNDGCMTVDEYKGFTAGTPEIATRIYNYFDPDNTNCLTVDKVAGQFDLMDTDGSGKVDPTEFKNYYLHLLAMLFGSTGSTTKATIIG